MGDYETYEDLLQSKRLSHTASGRHVAAENLHPTLFPFQRDLTRWALAKGRSALFADTGLGKTRMQLEWARHCGQRPLLLAPLAVAHQTVIEAQELGVELVYARKQADAGEFTITNYEMVQHFDPSAFGAVVLDESGCLKNFEGKTRTELIRLFKRTPMRLCCTATPAPNDISEIANHAEFLGILTRVEMLATFFVHDDEGWRLKGHAREPFYQWMASWGMSLKKPSDLGYSDEGYNLPPLSIIQTIVNSDATPSDRLFQVGLKGIQDRAAVRKATLCDRVAATARLVEAEPDEPWLFWCGLNDEGRELGRIIPDTVVVEGSDSPEQKAEALLGFSRGQIKRLATKGRIAGFGMNFQNCARMAFVGLNDSYEQYYQLIRRCYRFGQKREVHAHIILSEAEQDVYSNVLRKEREAEHTSAELVKHLAEFERAEIRETHKRADYLPGEPMRLPLWLNGATIR